MPIQGIKGGEKLEAFVARMHNLLRGQRVVSIGVQGRQEGEEHPESDVPLAMILAVHEFGTDDGVVPERAPLRTTAARNQSRWVDTLARGIRAVERGKATTDQMLGLAGAQAVADTKMVIRESLPPSLAESTLEEIRRRKGNRKKDPIALIDTGTLFKSITWAIRRRGRITKQQGGV